MFLMEVLMQSVCASVPTAEVNVTKATGDTVMIPVAVPEAQMPVAVTV